MNFADIFAKLPEAEQALLTEHIASQVQDAVTKAIEPLNGEIAALKNVPAPPPTEDPTAEAMKNLPEDLKAILQQSIEAKTKAEAALQALEKEKELRSFKDQLNIFDALPIEDKHVVALYELAQTSPENYSDMQQILKVANEAMKAGFSAIGTAQGKETDVSAYGEIQSRIAKLRETTANLDYNEAFRQVVAADPELYERYRDERPVHPNV